jgi:WD40 repeat protein
MRCVPVLLLLAPAAIVTAAAPPRAKPPRLDINGDPLPAGAVARLGSLRFQPPASHNENAKRWMSGSMMVALSPDGTTIVVATYGEKAGARVDFLDASTGKIVRTLDVAGDVPQRMQFTPDGKSLVFSTWTGIHRADARTGKVGKAIVVFHGGDYFIALTPDGRWVAAQPTENVKHSSVVVWDAKTGKKVASLPGRGGRCSGLVFGPGGKRLLLWSVVFDPDSKKDLNAAIACIDVATRKVVAEETVKTSQFVALSPDGETVAIETPDHKGVRVRHLPTGADRCVVRAKTSKFAFLTGGKVLFTIDEGGQGALWDSIKGVKVRDLEGALVNKDFEIVGVSKDGRTIAALDGGWLSAARVVVWDGATGKRIARPAGHDGAVTCIAYAPGGKVLASGGIDRTVRLWDPATGKQLRVLAVHKGAVTALAFSPDGRLVASAGQSGLTRVSSVASGKVVAALAGPDKGATALAFSPDGKVLLMGGGSPEVLGRQVAGGKKVLRLKTGEDGAVMALGNGGALALTGNGKIRAGLAGERLRVWDLTQKRPAASLPTLDAHGGSVFCEAAVFSQGARLVASSQVSVYQGLRPYYGNDQLRLWERAGGEPIRTLAPAVTHLLAFSPSGRFLAAGGAGRSGHLIVGYGQGVDVWDTLTGKKVGALPVTPTCVAFSPDGSRLATGDRDHCVLIWEAPKGQPRRRALSPSAAQRDVWWAALGGDAKNAYATIGEMTDAPGAAVALLQGRVPPVKACDPAAAARLIARLGSPRFAERQEAERALEQWGEGVAHHLVKALRGDPDLELRRRVERLLTRCNETSTASKRNHRAVAALEWIGTPAARALLRRLAGGAPGARLTVEARAALARLGR